MNKLILMGRLVRDPEVRYTNNEKVVCQFTIAVDRPWQKDNTTADFIPCVTWSKQAETIGNYFHKGNKILVEGRLQISKYTDKEGNNRERAECWVERFNFVEGKNAAGSAAPAAPARNGSFASAMEAFGSEVDVPF